MVSTSFRQIISHRVVTARAVGFSLPFESLSIVPGLAWPGQSFPAQARVASMLRKLTASIPYTANAVCSFAIGSISFRERISFIANKVLSAMSVSPSFLGVVFLTFCYFKHCKTQSLEAKEKTLF